MSKATKTRCYSREDFLNEWDFPLKPARDFELLGHQAEYASGHPKEWGQETESFEFGSEIKGLPELPYAGYSTAVSPDQRLLAISSNYERILVYDIESKVLRQTLEGTGTLVFRPTAKRVHDDEGADTKAEEAHTKPAYTLISSINDLAHRTGNGNKLIIWELDQHGRLLDEEEPIDPSIFTTKAIDAILPELEAKHEWSKDFVAGSDLRVDFERALVRAATDHRRRHNTVLENAALGGFGSVKFSSDGKLLLYHYQNRTTQHGMREPRQLPHVIVYDLDAGKELHRLFGHTDAIMWSGISPDDQHIASVSWDGTLRMYCAATSELEWETEDSGGQSWAGAFSPNSEYIVWSSKSGRLVKVHAVADGREISTFTGTLNHWCRCLVWNPDGKQIALCVNSNAYVWRPLDGPEGTIAQHFEFDEGSNFGRMGAVETVSWMEDGRLLGLEISEGTKLIYDTYKNAKELFKRPHGVHATWTDGALYGIFHGEGDQDFYLSVDGDGKVRYWRLSAPAYPSWWEKEKEENVAATNKDTFPETGKYVKITKSQKKDEKVDDTSRDAWAEKGAELWSAE